MSKSQEAQELRLIRKQLGLTHAGMAELLQISKSLSEKYESGDRTIPLQRLESARALKARQEAKKEAPAVSAQTVAAPETTGKTERFERWIQGCWMLFFVSAVWLVLRIAALQVGADFLRVGPNDEALGIAFLLFIGLTVLLANETWRRACHGLPIRNQRRAA